MDGGGLPRFHERERDQLFEDRAVLCSAVHDLRTIKEGVFPVFHLAVILLICCCCQAIYGQRQKEVGYANETCCRSAGWYHFRVHNIPLGFGQIAIVHCDCVNTSACSTTNYGCGKTFTCFHLSHSSFRAGSLGAKRSDGVGDDAKSYAR